MQLGSNSDAHDKLMLRVKIVVYTLLLLNFGYYWFEEYRNAQHTLTQGATLLQWMAAYAATLDDFAWLLLIAVYELETYWLEDDFDNKLVEWLMQLTKIGCYVLILQTTYSYIIALIDIYNVTPVKNVAEICALAGQDLSLLRNLVYTEISSENCASLSLASEFFRYPGEPVVTDGLGLAEDITLRQVDIIENIAWLLIVAIMELNVRLQTKGLHDGPAIKWSNRVKTGSYAAIILASVYWITKGHYVYAWDEFVWIAGFVVLDSNLAEWRHELEEAEHKGETSSNSPNENSQI